MSAPLYGQSKLRVTAPFQTQISVLCRVPLWNSIIAGFDLIGFVFTSLLDGIGLGFTRLFNGVGLMFSRDRTSVAQSVYSGGVANVFGCLLVTFANRVGISLRLLANDISFLIRYRLFASHDCRTQREQSQSE